jgi:hypothetical protein
MDKERQKNKKYIVYDNNFTSIIDLYFIKHSLLQTFEKVLALQSLDTLSDVRIKVFMLLF